MTKKLNSMRLLEQNGVLYETISYGEPDAFHDAVEVAEMLGVPVDRVYKTLVVEAAGSSKPCLALIAADRSLDLKRLAAVMGVKKAAMAAHKDAERWTGLKVGGISALALTQKNWPVYLDQPALEHEHILVSAGQRGMQLRVPTTALIQIIKAKVADISTAP
ncbi:MAG: aminoacyl-tRNA deacylase [Anaerolineae bacterium]|nr:aminoacyl-tRNA deacylase [Anaerolineae bacterium]